MTTITEQRAEEMYKEMLNDVYPEIVLGYSCFGPAEVLKEMDPIAYQVGLNDYMSDLESEGYEIEETKMELQNQPLYMIALTINEDWKKPYFGAVPYIRAMSCLNSINDDYGLDSGSSIVAYFLSNATTWRGQVAREIKTELSRRLTS